MCSGVSCCSGENQDRKSSKKGSGEVFCGPGSPIMPGRVGKDP